MTLDVTIGKVIVSLSEDDDDGIFFLSVEQCPKENHDICNVKHTLWPRDSYRSGSTEFRDFWTDVPWLRDIYFAADEGSRGTVLQLKRFEEHIFGNRPTWWEGAENTGVAERHKDRLKWLQFWSKRALNLYGDEAAIMFG